MNPIVLRNQCIDYINVNEIVGNWHLDSLSNWNGSCFWVSSGLLPGLLSKLNNDKFIPVDEYSVLPNLYGYEIYFFYLVGAVRVWRKKLDFKYSYKTRSGARSRVIWIDPDQSGKIKVLIFHMKKTKKQFMWT